jgi:hypothetical protein
MTPTARRISVVAIFASLGTAVAVTRVAPSEARAPAAPPAVSPAVLRSPQRPASSDVGRCAEAHNLALNPDRKGMPSPLESDQGWGGGANIWELVDGRRSYESWAHGLAFTGGHATSAGGPPYGAPAGPRQATIDFGVSKRLERVVIWQHGVEHTPQETALEIWDSTDWVPLHVTRTLGEGHEDGQGSGYADADTYVFEPMRGSKLRYAFNNSGKNVNGTLNIHGWLYEIEVFGCD